MLTSASLGTLDAVTVFHATSALNAGNAVQVLSVADAVPQVTTVVLAVKPQDTGAVLETIRPHLQPGTLVVSEHARIDGEVQAAHIVVNGTINGPLDARESLELQALSRVKGDVHYKSLEIQQGAVIEGRLVHHASEVKAVELKVAK
mgnify:CR=1 FL=1